MKAELSFDLVMEDDMAFVEGCYRLQGQDWQVFMFRKSRGLEKSESARILFGKVVLPASTSLFQMTCS